MRRPRGLGGSNLPPGTSPGDPRAPWNDPPAPECPDCRETIQNGGDHAGECEMNGATPEEVAEAIEEAAKPTEPEDHPNYEERLRGDRDE